jgi:hypothetical protein
LIQKKIKSFTKFILILSLKLAEIRNIDKLTSSFTKTGDIVALGQKEGTFSSDIHVDTAAKMIRSIIDGCLIQWLMCDEDHLHEFYKKTCYDVIFKYLK